MGNVYYIYNHTVSFDSVCPIFTVELELNLAAGGGKVINTEYLKQASENNREYADRYIESIKSGETREPNATLIPLLIQNNSLLTTIAEQLNIMESAIRAGGLDEIMGR